MMTGSITLIVVLLVAGIILLNRSSLRSIKTREEYLKQLAHYMESKLEPIEGSENCYKIRFNFEGYDFTYEDYIIPGFNADVNKAYLSIRVPGSLTLQFHERTHSGKIISNNLTLINTVDVNQKSTKVNVPPKLMEFTIQSNDVERLNKLFSDKKFVSLISNFKNQDPRGYSFMALEINDGKMIIDFQNESRYYPNLITLRKNLHLVEDPLNDIINIHKLLEKYD